MAFIVDQSFLFLFSFHLISFFIDQMEKSSENNDQQQHQGDVVDLSASVVITQPVSTEFIDDPNKINQPTGLSLVQSLLEQTEDADPKKKKKKKKAKTGRQKEIVSCSSMNINSTMKFCILFFLL